MTILTALDQAYKTRPTAAHKSILTDQLMRGLEGEVAAMFGMDPPEYEFVVPEPPDVQEDLELLMPYPYDDIYLWYLCAQIDLANEETQLYENDLEVFNAAWARAQAWYRRETRKFDKRNWKVM